MARREPAYTRTAATAVVTSPDAITTVLVVEDDPAVAELIRTVINDVPTWGAVVAYDAPSAIDLLEHLRADVLVVDVMLPGTTGIELLASLRRRANWHDPPVLVMSANIPAQAVEQALGSDVDTQFLAKPFDIDELVESISRVLEARRRDREGPLRIERPEAAVLPSPSPAARAS